MDVEHSSTEMDHGISKAPSLYERPFFYRQTRKKGKILKNVSERYLRDDLGLGYYYESSNDENLRVKEARIGRPRLIRDAPHLLSMLRPCKPNALVVCDTNVLIHNLDLLEMTDTVMPNVVFVQTALLELRSNSSAAYERVARMMREVENNPRFCVFLADQHHVETAHVAEADRTSINDENDARIRHVAALFAENLTGSDVRVILLTDDKGSREKADGALYEARSVRSWAQELEKHHPDLSLLDTVANFEAQVGSTGEARKNCFPRHLPASDISDGVKSGTLYRAVFRSLDDTNGRITIRKGDERVVVSIRGRMDRNRALDGDVVAVALHSPDQWLSSPTAKSKAKSNSASSTKAPLQAGIAPDTAEPTQAELSNVSDVAQTSQDGKAMCPTGKIAGIMRRNFGSYCGSICSGSEKNGKISPERRKIVETHERQHPDGTTTCVFFPVDKKIPTILIRTSQKQRLVGQRILVTIDSWPADSHYPLGHYTKLLGPIGSKDVETQVLLLQHAIPHEPFSAAVLACLPPADFKFVPTPDRTDLRHIPVMSIDPPGCKDIDDALHCTQLDNGNYSLGVHIADVTHYVKPGTAIDLEAASRSTSTYLVNRRLDMLPALLTTDLCSLKGNVDRYAFSVIWEVTPDAQIVDVEFKKSIIHSVAALTYQQAQSMIDQPEKDDGLKESSVKRLAKLARQFRKRRIDAGALTLASPEVKFVLDSESLNPTDVQSYQLLEANALVEEFMLLANVTVAKKILRSYPTLSVLRRHPSPNRAMFQTLISKARSRGFEIKIEDSKQLADSLDDAVIESEPYFNKLLRILSTRCMSPAQYFCSGEYRATDWHHYGLAAPVYTHFTSPIRRYADVCVHRLLAAAINVAPLPAHLSSKSYMHDLCENMNRRHRSAQLAGRSSVQLHTLIFFSGDDGAKVEDAYVLDIDMGDVHDSPTMSIIIPRYGIEGRTQLPTARSADGDTHPDISYTKDDERHTIAIRRDGKEESIQVFDKVRVRIYAKEIQDGQKDLKIDLVAPALFTLSASATDVPGGEEVANADKKSSKKQRGRDSYKDNADAKSSKRRRK